MLSNSSRDRVAGHAHHEQIAEPLVEDYLWRYSRIGAGDDDSKRRLPASERFASGGALAGMGRRAILEPLISGHEPRKPLRRAESRSGCTVCSNDRAEQDYCQCDRAYPPLPVHRGVSFPRPIFSPHRARQTGRASKSCAQSLARIEDSLTGARASVTK